MAVATPALHTDFSVDAATRARFDRNGCVKLRGVLDPATVAAWAPTISQTVIDLNTEHLPLAERDTYGKAFLQVSNIWQSSEAVKSFAFTEDLARIAAELLDVRAVRMYHDQALYKEPERRLHTLARRPVLLAVRHRSLPDRLDPAPGHPGRAGAAGLRGDEPVVRDRPGAGHQRRVRAGAAARSHRGALPRGRQRIRPRRPQLPPGLDLPPCRRERVG